MTDLSRAQLNCLIELIDAIARSVHNPTSEYLLKARKDAEEQAALYLLEPDPNG